MWRDGADFGRGETRTPPRGLLLPSVGRLSMTYATHTDSIIFFSSTISLLVKTSSFSLGAAREGPNRNAIFLMQSFYFGRGLAASHPDVPYPLRPHPLSGLGCEQGSWLCMALQRLASQWDHFQGSMLPSCARSAVSTERSRSPEQHCASSSKRLHAPCGIECIFEQGLNISVEYIIQVDPTSFIGCSLHFKRRRNV
jgi:hypothetical protein